MGSFIGHAIPGSFFFLYGFWWVTQAFRRHFRCRQTRQPYQSTMTFPFPYCSARWPRLRAFPVESVLKMVLCGMGIGVEIEGGINGITHRFDSIGNAQHITMYFFYSLTGLLDILVLKDLAPVGSDYVGAMLALLVEGALFKFHLFGRDQLDVLLHVLLLYVIGFTVVVVGVEAACRRHSVLPVLRGLLLMIQGTWFWGVGFILYNPFPHAKPWDREDHHSLMLAVVCFSWHVAVNVILVIAVGAVTGCYHRNRARYYSKLSSMPLGVLRREGKGEEEEEEEVLLSREGKGSVVAFKDELDDDDDDDNGGGQTKNGGLLLVHDNEDLYE